MNNITIGFSKPKTSFPIFSWLIRWHLKTPFSHVYIKVFLEEFNREVIFESMGHGTRMIETSDWEQKAQEVASKSINISHGNFITVVQYCIDHQSSKYGYLQNLGVFISDIFRMKHNIFTSSSNCSEFIYNILKTQGYHLDKNKNLITPKDIHDLLLK